MGFVEVKEKAEAIQKAVSECSMLVGPVGNERIPGEPFEPGLSGMSTYSSRLKEIGEDLKSSMFKTMFMGTFKNGKSTTINAILGEEMLPVGATATTAVISQVVYGTNQQEVKIFKNNSDIPQTMSFDRFMEEYKLSPKDIAMIEETGALDRFQDTDYVMLESSHELFRDGVQLIDSPGLEEAVARTKATEKFVPQANAIVFLLDAVHPFSAKEKTYIKQHFVYAEPKPRNVFFVMNRINQCSSDADREAVKQQTRIMLEPVFTTDGIFDEDLYNKRVFFVNAYGAFMDKKAGRQPIGTGMMEFQAALEDFLTSEDRVLARYQSVAANLAGVFQEAERQTREAQALMGKPIEELQRNSQKSAETLDDLEKKVQRLGAVIDKTSALVSVKIMNDLERFLTVDMPNAWKEYARLYDGKFGITDMIKVALPLKEEAKEDILRPMTVYINDFVEEQLDEWSRRVGLLIDPDIQAMKDDLEDESREFDLQLTMARNVFSGQEATWEQKGANKLQLALSLIQGDYSVAVENAAGGNFNWGEFAKRYVVQAVINIMIMSLVGGGLPGLVVAVAVELVQMGLHRDSTKERLLNGMADKLFPKLADELLEKRDEIAGNITGQFDEQKRNVTQSAQELILDERQHQVDTLNQMRKQEKDIQQEQDRQRQVLAALYSRLELVYRALYNKNLTPDSVSKLAASINVGAKGGKE